MSFKRKALDFDKWWDDLWIRKIDEDKSTPEALKDLILSTAPTYDEIEFEFPVDIKDFVFILPMNPWFRCMFAIPEKTLAKMEKMYLTQIVPYLNYNYFRKVCKKRMNRADKAIHCLPECKKQPEWPEEIEITYANGNKEAVDVYYCE